MTCWLADLPEWQHERVDRRLPAALGDIEHLARRRGLTTPSYTTSLGDLVADAMVTSEQSNDLRRKRLTAAREALLLFAAAKRAMSQQNRQREMAPAARLVSRRPLCRRVISGRPAA